MCKILVFIDWYLPGYRAGGPIRSMVNMVSHLADKYEFLIVTRDTDYMENEAYSKIEPNKWNKISDNQSVYYISKEELSIKKIKELIKSTDIDVVYINGVYSFYFSVLPLVLMRYFFNKKTIVAPRGMLSSQGLSVKVFRKKLFLFFAQITRLYKKAIIHVTGSTEYPDVEKLRLKQQKISFALNLPPFLENIKNMQLEKKAGELKMVCIARIAPEKNTLFALQCLNNTYQGKIKFDLFGTVYQDNYWEACKELISVLPSNISVNFKGQLDNTKVFSVLQDYHFMFLPTLGESFGHSILESLMAGCPVIISDRTPWKKLGEKEIGWEIELDKPKLFTETIQYALDLENEEYKEMSDNAANYAQRYFNLPEILDTYTELFE